MTYSFYSLATQEADVASESNAHQDSQANAVLPWPATYRDDYVLQDTAQYTLTLSSDDEKHHHVIDWQQLIKMPSTTEVQKLHSKAGWMYQGFWATLTFQRLFAKIPGYEHYSCIRLKSLNGQEIYIPKNRMQQYRLVFKCDDKLIPPLYGGPVMVVNFENYVEYAVPQVQEICLLSTEHTMQHPNNDIGFSNTAMKVQNGNYYLIHKEHIKHLRYS